MKDTTLTNQLTHPHLTAEEVNDEHGKAIMLTQQEDGYNEPNTVLLHPWQLRAVCEQFGIIVSDSQAAKTIDTLQRRMVVLRDRIGHLAEWMAQRSDHEHADLTQAVTQLQAMQDLAREWCVDFDDDEQATPAKCSPVQAELL